MRIIKYKLNYLLKVTLFIVPFVTPTMTQGTFSDMDSAKSIIVDFNQKLFIEMNPEKAVSGSMFLRKGDLIDVKAGFTPTYYEVTKKVPTKDRLKYFVLDFYFEESFPMLTWRMGKSHLSIDARFNEEEWFELNNGELKHLWNEARTRSGINSAGDDPMEQRIDVQWLFLNELKKTIGQNVKSELIQENLEMINKGMTIKQEVSNGRRYFVAQNQFLLYRVAMKSGKPKIMSVSRIY